MGLWPKAGLPLILSKRHRAADSEAPLQALVPQSLFPPRFLHKPRSLKTAAISKPFISTDREVEVAGGMAGKILRKGPGWPQAKVEPFQPTKAAFMS